MKSHVTLSTYAQLKDEVSEVMNGYEEGGDYDSFVEYMQGQFRDRFCLLAGKDTVYEAAEKAFGGDYSLDGFAEEVFLDELVAIADDDPLTIEMYAKEDPRTGPGLDYLWLDKYEGQTGTHGVLKLKFDGDAYEQGENAFDGDDVLDGFTMLFVNGPRAGSTMKIEVA